MSVCTFFGHSENCAPDMALLSETVENLIHQGVSAFLVGHQGQFDRMVQRCLRLLQAQYPHIRCSVVLTSLAAGRFPENRDGFETALPESVHTAHPKFSIEQRNRWMVEQAQYCVCYIDHPWGGAYKFVQLAKRKRLVVINLGAASI